MGDRMVIEEMVKYVKSIVDKNGPNSGANKFSAKEKKPIKQHSKLKTPEVHVTQLDPEKLKLELIQKVDQCMKLYGANEILDSYGLSVSDDMIVVHIKKGIGIYGTIRCILCDIEQIKNNKPKRVYYSCESDWPCWVVSNYAKHLRTAHKLKLHDSKPPTSPNDNLPTEFDSSIQFVVGEEIVEVDVVEEIIIDETELVGIDIAPNNTDENTKNEENVPIYTQLSKQVTLMMSAALQNKDEQEQMTSNLNDGVSIDITVSQIDGNGHCLFSALYHQLFQMKINSRAHRNGVKKLRKEVVEHILNPTNYPTFEFQLKDRVYEMNEGRSKSKKVTDMESKCKTFVKNNLSANAWGGAETIRAVSDMYKVNVININECGECYMLSDSTRTFNRSVLITYRLIRDGEGNIMDYTKRNHYDSVADINSHDLYALAQTIESKIKK